MKPTEQHNLAGIHVLLVDDNEDALAIFGAYLRHLGALVTVAHTGAEALALLTQARADVIVTDLSMREMGGIEFLVRLRDYRGDDTHPPPVIAVTAFPDNYGPKLAEDTGFRAFLVKPVTPIRLATEVRRMFDYMKMPEDKS
jgi:CheY-like chemotaxis protein